MGESAHAAYVRVSDDNPQESVLSFSHVGSQGSNSGHQAEQQGFTC